MTDANRPRERRDIVTLADLAPRRDVTGGAAPRVFGSEPLAGPDDWDRTLPDEREPGGARTGERPR